MKINLLSDNIDSCSTTMTSRPNASPSSNHSPIANIAAVLFCLLSIPALAQDNIVKYGQNSFGNVAYNSTGKSLNIYKHVQPDGVVSFSDEKPQGRPYEIVRLDCYACDVNSKVDWYATRLYLNEYSDTITLAARQHGVDPALVRALIHAESAFNPKARSNKGAMGLMQLMPGTARDMGVSNPAVPDENIQGGVKYLAYLLDKFNGDTTLATAAYNAGPGAVNKYNGIPPYAETQAYVQRVKILHERYRTQS